MSKKLLELLGLDDDIEVVIIRRSKVKEVETPKFYQDKEGSVPGQQTTNEKEFMSAILKQKLEEAKKRNEAAQQVQPEFISLTDIEALVAPRKSTRYFKDDNERPTKRQRTEYVKEPGEITPQQSPTRNDNKCGLCRIPGHTLEHCHNVCPKSNCKNNLHFKDNCPLEKPCVVCHSYNHSAYDCYQRCRESRCRYFRKYHSSNKCNYRR